MSTALRCAGCGAVPRPGERIWACAKRASGDDIDHVIRRDLSLTSVAYVASDDENPFIRHRQLLYAWHLWRDAGRSDASFVSLVETLDQAVVEVDGRGFRRTPMRHAPSLDEQLGCQVWVKDETGNVAGSHKGRHLFGLGVLLEVLDHLGRPQRGRLAIASCGNAALAAAVVAAGLGRPLDVFVPEDAEASVVRRLRALGATITVCRREPDASGDPCYRRFRGAVESGAVPFGCQGPDNGLCIEGGHTLAWELAEQLSAAGVEPDRVVVQVGGGALASACRAGLEEARALSILARQPIFDTVQTSGAAPLARAVALMGERHANLEAAVHHRSQFMWPWGVAPASVARGILDDETYDWAAVVEGMRASGGTAVIVDEATLIEANSLARSATGIDVDHTGSAGLAGLLKLARAGAVAPTESAVVVFSGVARDGC